MGIGIRWIDGLGIGIRWIDGLGKGIRWIDGLGIDIRWIDGLGIGIKWIDWLGIGICNWQNMGDANSTFELAKTTPENKMQIQKNLLKFSQVFPDPDF